MNPPVATICFCMLLVLGCYPSDEVVEMKYRSYKEGPHVILRDESANVVYFKKMDKTWTMEQQFLSDPDSAIIEVDNPVTDPFQVQLNLKPSPSESEYPSASKITVVADIEGNFAGFHSLLVAQKVIDESGNWIYGDGHLVMLGDLFDRGPDVTPIFWLLYKIESEARAAGGYVHTLLGNHEIMNFNSDLRYLHKKYKSQSKDTGFEYQELYNMETVLGQWLRRKPAIVRIGNVLFTHAGISPEVLELNISLQEINALVVQRNLNPEMKEYAGQSETIFGSNGIFWYRSWVDDPGVSNVLDELLVTYHVDHMVIGHTIVREIQASFNYKLIAIDLHQPSKLNNKPLRALTIEGESFYEIDNRGGRKPIKSN